MSVIKISDYNSNKTVDESSWSTLQWAASITLSGTNGPRQKLTMSGNTTITAPTLSATYTELTLEIVKTSSYSFTIGGVTTTADETTLLSWYWDGSNTRRLPNVYLGD